MPDDRLMTEFATAAGALSTAPLLSMRDSAQDALTSLCKVLADTRARLDRMEHRSKLDLLF